MIRWNKGLCNNYLEVGGGGGGGGGVGVKNGWGGGGGGGLGGLVWKVSWGGIGENNSKREKGLDVKFNTYRGDYFFIPFCKLEK